MDAFSPPLEPHLDNLAKIVKAVLKRPSLPAADVPARPAKPSIPKPPIRPSRPTSIVIAITIAAFVIVGGAGWYLGQKKNGPPEKPAVTPTGTSTPVPITPAVFTPVRSPVPTLTIPLPGSNVMHAEGVRNFLACSLLADERGDIESMLAGYGVACRPGPERRNRA